MPIPATGGTWKEAGLSEVDNRFYSRGGLAAILIRDNRGAATNLSPYTKQANGTIVRNWSPFSDDGKLRKDLFASIRQNGEWITNPNPNEGFWLIGALSEDGGVERSPNISQDNAMILQSNNPFDSDITEEGITINFTGVETLKPLLKRLRMNLPLSDSSGNPIVEDPGTQNFVLSKPLDGEGVERQIVLIFARRKGGKYIYTAEVYPLAKLTEIGSYSRSKTDADAAQLGFTVLPDPYMVDYDAANPGGTDLVPVLYSEFHAGDGWTAIGGVPVFPGSAPTVTGTGSTAAVVFAEATGAGDPFTYTVEKKVGAAQFVAATISSVTRAGGNVTLNVSGLTTGSTTFRVTAKGTNGNTAISATSNAITVT